MKKLITLVGMVAVMAMMAGCFTSAGAHTKKTVVTVTEGAKITTTTTTESEVNVTGTGDKVSQVATEGLFADGQDDALGAGVRSAKANQQSTGIGGAMAELVQGLEVIDRIKNGGVKAQTATPAPALALTADTPVAPEVVDTAPAVAAKPVAVPSTPRSSITAEGVPVVAIFGNRATCSRCRTLWGNLDAAALSAALCNASVIDADMTDNPSVYNAMRPKSAFTYPLAVVYDAAGKLAGQFDAKGLSQAQIAEKVKALVPACASTQ